MSYKMFQQRIPTNQIVVLYIKVKRNYFVLNVLNKKYINVLNLL